MSLIAIRSLDAHTRLGLWRMDEPFTGTPRQRERYAVGLLLEAMLGRPVEVEHLPDGRPVLSGYHISISHTRGFAAVILSDSHSVGVDIEYTSDRVGRIASKFIRPDEVVGNITDMLLLWSAKETLYKLHTDDRLDYFQMRLLSRTSETMVVENMKRSVAVEVVCETTDDYVLTYAIEREYL